jgi:hypothetical protein
MAKLSQVGLPQSTEPQASSGFRFLACHPVPTGNPFPGLSTTLLSKPLLSTVSIHSRAHLEGIEELEDHLANSESCLAQTCYLLEWLCTDANQYLQSEAP